MGCWLMFAGKKKFPIRGHFGGGSKPTHYQKKNSLVSRVVELDPVGCVCGFGFDLMRAF